MWLVKREPMKFITINSKLGDAPMFYCKKDEQATPEFIWDLVSITVREPNEKADFASINLAFIDDDLERYVVSLWFNSLATSIINTLAWAVDAKLSMKKVDMSLYTKDGYPRCGMTFDGQRASWKYDMKDLLAKTKKVKVNGKDVTDREELDNFLREVIKEINSYLNSLYGAETGEEFIDRIDAEMANKEQAEDGEIASKIKEEAKSDYDDLPF